MIKNGVTVEEAQGMLCPIQPGTGELWCIGPKCMGWRWVPESMMEVRLDTSGTLILEATKVPKERWTGYCGLAGRIERIIEKKP